MLERLKLLLLRADTSTSEISEEAFTGLIPSVPIQMSILELSILVSILVFSGSTDDVVVLDSEDVVTFSVPVMLLSASVVALDCWNLRSSSRNASINFSMSLFRVLSERRWVSLYCPTKCS